MTQSALSQSELALLELSDDDKLEVEIERRVALRCEARAYLWKFQLVVAEAFLMAGLVVTAGGILGFPIGMTLWVALLVASSCLSSGVLMMVITHAGARLVTRIRRRLGR